jgi:hypothetical protein
MTISPLAEARLACSRSCLRSQAKATALIEYISPAKPSTLGSEKVGLVEELSALGLPGCSQVNMPRARPKVALTGRVNQEEGGLPACTVLTANISPNQCPHADTSVDLPVASGPTKAMIVPPTCSILFFSYRQTLHLTAKQLAYAGG